MNPEQFIRIQVERKTRDMNISSSVLKNAQDHAVDEWRKRNRATNAVEEAVKMARKQRGV